MSDQNTIDLLFSSLLENKSISGVNPDQFAFIFRQVLQKRYKKSLFIFKDESSAEKFFQTFNDAEVLFYPGLGSDCYSSIIPSQSNLFKRFDTVNSIQNKSSFSLISTVEALGLYLPDFDFFSKKLTLEVSQIISPLDLASQLVQLGYHKTITIEEPGTFSNRGEIFDIYPISGKPIRIYYFDDMIESIFYVEKETSKTIRDVAINSFDINKTALSLLDEGYAENFKNNFPRPKISNKALFDYRKSIFNKVTNRQFFEDYPLFISYFTNAPQTLSDYLEDYHVFIFDNEDIKLEHQTFLTNLSADYQRYLRHTDDEIKPKPEELYDFSCLDKLPPPTCIDNIDYNTAGSNQSLRPLAYVHFPKNKAQNIKNICVFIDDLLNKKEVIYIVYKSEREMEEIKYILLNATSSGLEKNIIYIKDRLEQGFSIQDLHFISSSDFFSNKVKKAKKISSNDHNDLFADQMATLEIGDYIVHKDYGLGEYRGIETLELTGNKSDYIVLHYQDNDKVYVPIYRLNLLQKFSTKQATVTLANLKTKKFEQVKQKAKKSVKKLAFDLLELQAKRNMQKSFAFSPPGHDFNEFSLSFQYEETEDQARAIEDVIQDMQSTKPMDRLVCGDVGFGKTEVAMRAAYKAVLDGKQVCILVPTTVLCLQHFNSFIDRFKATPVNIESLSRFKTAKQSNEVIEKLATGKVDIVIGTHKLLSEKIKYQDLGLIIVDEEQRFGVGHKEKLKLLKENVDTLTLTATPIPRTLQLSFLGIKELSLIKTAPPKRQSIKSYIIKEDFSTIQTAINKELSRGGQVFIVHNKVQDMEIYTAKIRDLVPTAKIVFAHGQLSEKELERRIADFYQHKFDILIATTIIESGIDIPNANTMIVDRADTYGLSQLHQLRGRIGRSDKKAYAYFSVPKHKKLTEVATKRLKALQTYAEIGSGFSLASSDLEIRGSGDILGAEQSGHLANIGLELYMELLQEAIQNLKGESAQLFQDVEIQSAFNTFIPKDYIQNSNLRLKYYKKLSNKKQLTGIQDILDEMEDQFGQIPIEVNGLITFLKVRVELQGLGINKLSVKSHSITIYFNKEFIENNAEIQSRIISFFTQRPKIYKINPDFSIICKFKDKIDVDVLFDFAKHIAQQIKTC